MAAARPLHPPSHFSFLKEGLLLPARNPSLFAGPILAITIAENVWSVLLAMLPLHKAQDVILVVALNLLTSVIIIPVIWAIATFAAVTAYGVDNEGETLAFVQVLRRLFDGGISVGPVATAVHGQTMAVACKLGLMALLVFGSLLAWYTRTLLVQDLLVLIIHMERLAQIFFGIILSVAVVVSAFEPGCHRAAALRRAWVTIAKNAKQTGILVIASVVLAAAASPWHTTASRGTLNLVNLLVSGVERVFLVCMVTAYYNECRHKVQGRAEELLLIETGKEWLYSLLVQCRNKLQDILQGRFSMRHMLATLLAHLQCLCTWMLAFVSTHPWVACIVVACARRLIVVKTPSILNRNYNLAHANATV